MIMEKTIEIPEGYEARIEGNKVIFEQKESEDERIRESLVEYFRCFKPTDMWDNLFSFSQIIAYLERQKEQKPFSTEETELNSIAFLEQMGYTCIPPGKEQRPAEWSERDEKIIDELITIMNGGTVTSGTHLSEYAAWLKSLRPQPHWMPSKEQMKSLAQAVCIFACFDHLKDDSKVLTSLYNNLQKLLGI